VIVCDRQAALGRWLCARTGGTYQPGTGVYIGLETGGKLAAVAGFEDYNRASIRIHLAVDGKMTREFLRVAFSYPFEQLQVCKLIGIVSSANRAALRLDRHLGFVEEAVIKDACPDGNLHILTMTRKQCRFI
jgi:L-amino acid N-acyltransferase YncA